MAAAFHAPAAGFNLVIDPQALPAGCYDVPGLIGQDQAAEVCDMRGQLILGDPAVP